MIIPNFEFTSQFLNSLGIICTEGQKTNNNKISTQTSQRKLKLHSSVQRRLSHKLFTH